MNYRWAVVGFIVGVSLMAGYYHQSGRNDAEILTEVTLKAKHNPQYGLEVVKSIIATSDKLNDAVAVVATLGATQFGKEFYDTLSSHGRRSIIAHPYDKQGSGVSVTVTYTDARTGQRYIMLMRKLRTRDQQDVRLKDNFDPIGGYTKGAGVEGSSKGDLSFINEEARDAAEDKFVETGVLDSSPTISSGDDVVGRITRKDFDKIQHAVADYLAIKLQDNPLVRSFVSEDVKKFLSDHGVNYHKDYNSTDTAMREFIEETGYNGTIKSTMFAPVYTTDNYSNDNVANLHTIVTHYVIDLGKLTYQPRIYASSFKGIRDKGSFKANGSEIGELIWVSSEDIKIDAGHLLSYHDTKINPGYVPVLNNVARYLRDLEIKEQAHNLIESRNGVRAWIARFDAKLEVPIIVDEHGPLAAQAHAFDLCIANTIAKTKDLFQMHIMVAQCKVPRVKKG